MKIIYISPSLIPSNTANSIHVINQVKAFQALNYEITLFAARSIFRKNLFRKKLYERYDAKIKRLKTIYLPNKKLNELLIGLYAIFFCLFDKDKFIISRNLYASFILSLIYNGIHIYEVHELFTGYQMFLQKIIFKKKKIKFLAISDSLARNITKKYNINPNQIKVIHDAAPSDLEIVEKKFKGISISQLLLLDKNYLNSFKGVCVYSGSFGEGRGLEIIEEISKKLVDVLFIVVGGTDKELATRLKNLKNKNIIFTGFKKYKLALKIAACADILLMPYQKKVILGNKKRDVSMTMSPLKMFEYMGLKVPIISSDLPVLKEVLINKFNAILVESDNIESWCAAIYSLLSDENLSHQIAENANKNMLDNYTWEVRAKKILES